MGPYVLRSVNAHFKLWDEGVQDSFTEKLSQAPVGVIPNIPINCTCTNSAGSCGSSLAGSQCGANQRIYNHTCSLQGCDGAPASSCINDPSCCTAWVPVGCGTVPLGQPATSTNCNYGYQILHHQCGSNNSIQCSQDSNCPLPACLGIISPGATPCSNEPQSAATGLLQNNGITYVQDPTHCNLNSNSTCQYSCAPPFLLNPTGTSCLQTYVVAPVTNNSTSGGYNDWKVCVASGVTLTVKSQTPQSGCGNGISDNPPGTPGTLCTVSFTY